jgi:hypothetical protein
VLYNEIKRGETKQFNDNACKIVFKRDCLEDYLRSLGLDFRKKGDGYEFPCPVCQTAMARAFRGDKTPLAWACRQNKCQQGSYANLITLTRKVKELSLPDAEVFIAHYLGYENPWDITNGKFKSEDEV